MNNDILGLYVHIPFCNQICSYCDFYKMIATKEKKLLVIERMIEEINQKNKYFSSLKTIYIGGGTPSSLDLELLEQLLICIKDNVNINNILEYTIEANPNDINIEFIKLLKKYNINRISLGVQSLNKDSLLLLNRNHTKEEVVKAIQLLKQFDFLNINCDLIFGLPNDTFLKIKKDLQLLINLGVKHFSCYSLILEERTLLHNLYQKKQFIPLNDDLETAIYTKIQSFLEKNSYIQYEISNFSIDGYESIHNKIYWNNEHYIGIGPSASYYIDNIRYTNHKNIKKYCTDFQNSFYEKEILTKKDIMENEIMLGLRKCEGINVISFNNKFNTNIFLEFPNIDYLIKGKLLEFKNNNIFIKKDKLYISNTIIYKILY